jgi:hypothetical protein
MSANDFACGGLVVVAISFFMLMERWCQLAGRDTPTRDEDRDPPAARVMATPIRKRVRSFPSPRLNETP